jgi:hypothetical protein
MQKMIEEAVRAREALNSLTQDLSGFNLEHFKKLEGRYPLGELGEWVREAILKLGGAAIPDGEFWTLITPESLRQPYRLAPRYDRVSFNRELAMRVRNCEMAGLGHPLVDALIHALRQPAFQGSVYGRSGGKSVYAHYLVQYRTATGQLQGRLFNFVYDSLTNEVKTLNRFEIGNERGTKGAKESPDVSKARQRIESALQSAILEWLPDRQSRAGLHPTLIGLHSHS